ncbi:MAG: DHHW family protein, partial [Lachnospiraceae bacterium]|nr:DHHW family protein [Lachnospiraceae bacterium]
DMKNVNANVAFVLFPNACSIEKDRMWWVDKRDYQNDIMNLLNDVYMHSNIQYVDMRDSLKKLKDNNIDIYYRTDHHINSDAMYMVKDKILDSLSIKDDRQYDKIKLCDNFQGSLMSKSCVFKDVYDDIYTYIDRKPVRYVLFDYGEQRESASIYDFSKLDSYDPYLVFMGNNSKLINIKTENYEKKRLLVIKDSYVNCFIPYLLAHYSTIDIVDPRYVSDIKELVSYEEYDDILYFYNLNTYMGK